MEEALRGIGLREGSLWIGGKSPLPSVLPTGLCTQSAMQEKGEAFFLKVPCAFSKCLVPAQVQGKHQDVLEKDLSAFLERERRRLKIFP